MKASKLSKYAIKQSEEERTMYPFYSERVRQAKRVKITRQAKSKHLSDYLIEAIIYGAVASLALAVSLHGADISRAIVSGLVTLGEWIA